MITNQIFHGSFSTYEVQSRLGSGGMAIVYQGHDVSSHSQVAIKQVYDWLADSEEAIVRFHREVDVITRLSHPSIVPIIDSGTYQNAPFMVMPYYQSGSLAKVIQQKSVLAVGDILIYLSQIASALDYAHRRGIIHRDLKLENCLVGDDGHVLLADFGMAHVADATRLTFTGDLRGTPLVMAPEQARGDKNIGKAIDIYSLSVLAYMLITGYYPFTSNETMALINMHTSYLPPLPSKVNPDLPQAVDDVLLKGLSKFPDDRYESGMRLVEELDLVLATYAELPIDIHITGDNPLTPGLDTVIVAEMSDSIGSPSIAEKNKNQPSSGRRGAGGLLIAAVLVLVFMGGAITVFGGIFDTAEPTSESNQQVAVVVEDTATVTSSPTYTESPTDAPSRTVPPTATKTSTATATDIPTQTSTATATLTPTQTLTRIPLPGIAGIIIGEQGANIRQGAHSNYGIVTYLEEDETMRLVGRNYAATWLQALLEDDRQGWVFAELVDSGEEDVLDLPITWIEPTATLTPTPIPPTPIPQSNGGNNNNSNNSGNSNSSSGGGNSSSGSDSGSDNSSDDGGGGVVDTVTDIVGGLLK